MPHQRLRHLLAAIEKQASFWPVVGVLGMRQVGKSTLLREQLKLDRYVSFDDDDARAEAEASAKAFLARRERPLVIDEIQKVPSVFDAIKSAVDKKRIPGEFYVTGSSSFSGQKSIHESLTGRIGLCYLHPLTIAEANDRPPDPGRLKPIHGKNPRFKVEEIAGQLSKGGLPVPMFLRDAAMRNQYWKNWIATSLGRDLGRVFGRGFDPDFAERTLYELAKFHLQGILPTISNFKADSRKTKKYLNAFRGIFIVRMLPCHEKGTGRDVYLFTDSGFAASLMKQESGEDVVRSLVRIYIMNEIIANTHYAGLDVRWSYFKSRKGAPVDLVWDRTPLKIVTSVKQVGWEERALEGAMKTLQSSRALLVGPTDSVAIPRKKGIGLVPWSFWS